MKAKFNVTRWGIRKDLDLISGFDTGFRFDKMLSNLSPSWDWKLQFASYILCSSSQLLLALFFPAMDCGSSKSTFTLTTCYKMCRNPWCPLHAWKLCGCLKCSFSALIADWALVRGAENKTGNPFCSSSTICFLQASNMSEDGGSKLLQVLQVDTTDNSDKSCGLYRFAARRNKVKNLQTAPLKSHHVYFNSELISPISLTIMKIFSESDSNTVVPL